MMQFSQIIGQKEDYKEYELLGNKIKDAFNHKNTIAIKAIMLQMH
jgi:hypothetical protein